MRLSSTHRLVKQFTSLWEDAEKLNKLRLIMDNSDMLFFFTYKGDVYGTGENGRVLFAKMMDRDDEENTPAWRKEASFTATKISDLLDGKQNQIVLSDKECKKIDVLADREDVLKKLK